MIILPKEWAESYRCSQCRLLLLFLLILIFLYSSPGHLGIILVLSFPFLIPCIYSISKSCYSHFQNLFWIKFLLTTPSCHSILSNQATIICHMIYSNHFPIGLSDSILNPSQSLHTATSDLSQIKAYLSMAPKSFDGFSLHL